MNHQQIEMDIRHLEQVIRRISVEDRIPLTYWRNRVNSVSSSAVLPAQQSRLRRINDLLEQLEALV